MKQGAKVADSFDFRFNWRSGRNGNGHGHCISKCSLKDQETQAHRSCVTNPNTTPPKLFLPMKEKNW